MLCHAMPMQVVLPQCFRPGDIVRASVVSLGDARSYYLSTAQNELGVVYAKSIAGKRQATPMLSHLALRMQQAARATAVSDRCMMCCACAGAPMVPISWQEMECPQTKAVERRKVAKVSV